jgi:hypothetical protein
MPWEHGLCQERAFLTSRACFPANTLLPSSIPMQWRLSYILDDHLKYRSMPR